VRGAECGIEGFRDLGIGASNFRRFSSLSFSAVRLRAEASGLSAIGFGPQAGGELVAKATSRPS